MSQQSRINGDIRAHEFIAGTGAVVEPGVVICGKDGGYAESVILGDYCYVGRDVRIMCPEFRIGHYSKLHAGSFGHGVKPLQIGRNCWIGGNVVLDSMGGLDIDDNVGIGAGSQVWTHIQFGDVVEGCRFHSTRYMHLQKDAWFVGHCLVSPVNVGERAMALLGSTITKDMLPNHVYAGVPAVDVTAKVGPQFETRSNVDKVIKLENVIAEFELHRPEFAGQLRVAVSQYEFEDVLGEESRGRTWFDVSRRVYNRTYSAAEVAFLKSHTPLVKFTPHDEPSFIELQAQGEAVGA